MIKIKLTNLLILSVFIVGLLFVLPEIALSGIPPMGCCINNGSQCAGGSGDPPFMGEQLDSCTPSGSGNRLWVEGDFCSTVEGGNAVCLASGCCFDRSGNQDCYEGPDISCTDGTWESGDCTEEQCGEALEGCCENY